MNAAIWTGLGLVVNLNARASGPLPAGVTGVSIDTRTLQPGDLFFAIKGDNTDGHDYVERAFAKGAAAAVIDEGHADALAGKGSLFIVHDVLEAMVNLGRTARHRSPAWIAAVTGSVGKTTTKEALLLTLSRFGETHASAASYNNHWGVPLTLARMAETARFGVFEIGMNHAGEITPLVDMVRPHVAIVTAIAPVHLEHLGSIEAIADAKAEIFTGLMPDGVAIIHRDTPQFERLRDAAVLHAGEVLSFGEAADADARLISVRRHDDGSIVEADVCGERLNYAIGAPGRHIAMNSLAVLLAVRAMGCDVAQAAQTLGEFMAPKGRGAQAVLQAADGPYLLLDESYNANPASVRAALDVLGATPVENGGRRIAVLGDMLELGPQGAELHRGLAPTVVANDVDLVFAAGPLTRGLFDALPAQRQGVWTPSAAELAERLPERLRAGDVVMVKGSNGSRMGDVVAALHRLSARADAPEVPSC